MKTTVLIGFAGLSAILWSLPAMSAESVPSAPANKTKSTLVSYQTTAVPTAHRAVYLGNAPYICGPSGFGQTSKCFLRSAAR